MSVVIPVFNRAVPVRRAIASVLAQTCQDFEIIVVDDASTDDTAAAVAAVNDARLTLVRHDRKRGGAAARNTGIRSGTAPYVAFLDSDDEWLPTKLERQLAVFDRADDHLALVYAGTERVYADGSLDTQIPRRYRDIVRASLEANVIGDTSVGMVRRSALELVGGFDESLPAAQEMDLWVRICERFGVEFIPEPLARVAKGDDSGRITANLAATTRGREMFRQKHRQKMAECGVLHLHLRESAWRYLRGPRDAGQARRCCREAVRTRPLAPLTWILFAVTYVPLGWLDRMAGYKQRAVRILRGTRRALRLDASAIRQAS